MRNIRIFIILAVTMMLGACMKTSDMLDEGKFYLQDASVLDNHKIARAANRRIPADSHIYIVQSHFPPVHNQDTAKNFLSEEAFNAFVEYFPLMHRAKTPLALDEAFIAAAYERADFLLYLRFAEGTSRKPVGSASSIQLMLYDVASGYLVDHASIRSRGGLLTSLNKQPEDMLRKPMHDYAQRLLGLKR